MNNNKKRIFIVHGYEAGPMKHWFPWLMESFSASPIEIQSLSMPTPDHPVFDAWCKKLQESISRIDEHTFLIGHSLGTIALLKYLDQESLTSPLGGLILVAGFDKSLPSLPELDDFIDHTIDYKKLDQRILHKHIFASTDDPIVPYDFSLELSDKLRAPLHTYHDHGHFLESDGIKELPLIRDLLREMLKY